MRLGHAGARRRGVHAERRHRRRPRAISRRRRRSIPRTPASAPRWRSSHLAKGESERGLSELEAAAADDTGIRADLALVAANVRQRKFDAALAAVAALEKKQPDKPLPHNLRGAVLLAKGDVAGRAAELRARARARPDLLPGGREPRAPRSRRQEAGGREEALRSRPGEGSEERAGAARARRAARSGRRIARRSRRADRQGGRGEPDRAGAAARADLPLPAQPRSRRRRSPRRRTRSRRCRTAPRSWMPPARRTAPPATPIRRSRRTTSWRSCARSRRCRSCAWPRCRSPPRTTPPRCESLRKALAHQAGSASKPSARSSRWMLNGGRTAEALAAARDVQKQRPEGVDRLHPRGRHLRVEEGVERGRSRLSRRA